MSGIRNLSPTFTASDSRSARCAVPTCRVRERGAFGVMTVPLLLVMFALFAFAIDLGMVYNRKAELQKAADTIAIAAAKNLDGTPTGISNALVAAADTAAGILYSYNLSTVDWSDAAISFGSSANGTNWWPPGATSGKEAELLFVKVDISQLDPKHGAVNGIFSGIFSAANATVQVGSRAVAGRSTINVMPLGVCAMSTQVAESRAGELVQYGFRRGVSYDLMQLNPDTASYGATTPVNFLVNPIAPPGTAGTSVMSRMDVVQPFVCNGTMAMSRVTGASITVEPGFPLASLYQQLNSRFGAYVSPCTADGAPPDANVKEYKATATGSTVGWMTPSPKVQAPLSNSSDGKYHTVLDLKQSDGSPQRVPDGTLAYQYGPLWTYAKAAKYATGAEPPGGFATYTVTNADWAALYPPPSTTSGAPPFSPTVASYPSLTPYGSGSGSTFQAPPAGLKGVRDRRVLYIPLLQCPVASGTPSAATILAIGKFFMTVQATSSSLYGEFVGLAQESSLGGQVELYQ